MVTMNLSSGIGLALIGIALGLVGRLLGPRPTVRQAICCAVAGLVGGELGVLLGAQAAQPAFQWVTGLIVAALFVGVTVGWFVSQRGTYSPHTSVPPPARPGGLGSSGDEIDHRPRQNR